LTISPASLNLKSLKTQRKKLAQKRYGRFANSISPNSVQNRKLLETISYVSGKSEQNAAMKIGYARVSTTDQNPALQLAALKRERRGRISTDKTSGASRKCPEWTSA